MDRQIAVIGSYAETGGLHTYHVDPTDGSLRELDVVSVPRTAFVTHHPDEPFVYAARRTGDGVVSAFHVDPDDGSATRLNRQSSGGAAPGYVSTDATGQWCLVANCDGHTVAMLPIESDGRLGPVADAVSHPPEHSRDGEPGTRDPAAAHPHAVVPGPDNRFVYVPDLVTDRVYAYRIDTERGQIRPSEVDPIEVTTGSGPRHIVFGADGRTAYLVNEFASTITEFDREAATGALSAVQTAGTLPDGYAGDNKCADVHVHPSGRWVYASNRGHDSIAAFSVEDESGRLGSLGRESTRGSWPRDFDIDRTGRYLFAENMRSDSVVVFAVDPGTGALEPTGASVEIAEPISMTTMATD